MSFFKETGMTRQDRVRFFPEVILLLVVLLVIDLGQTRKAYGGCYDEASLTYDFPQRDRLAESGEWVSSKSKWGPHARRYPPVEVPPGCDPVKWRRLRVIAVAKRYIGLPYRHHHVPDWQSGARTGPGLDCSNFTAWVYNYGLGLKFTGDIHKQAEGPRAPGRRLQAGESFKPGDLLFIMKRDGSKVSHVAIFIDEDHIIDDTGGGVAVRPFAGWYKTHLSHARRLIE